MQESSRPGSRRIKDQKHKPKPQIQRKKIVLAQVSKLSKSIKRKFKNKLEIDSDVEVSDTTYSFGSHSGTSRSLESEGSYFKRTVPRNMRAALDYNK